MKIIGIILLIAILAAGWAILLSWNKIDLTAYPIYMDYGSLNEEQIAVMDAILRCGETVIEQNLSAKEFDQVIDCIGLYFGSCLAHQNVALWRPGYAEVKPDLLKTLHRDKAVLDNEIDRILSNMYEGTDRFKLWQISWYLAKTIRYSPALDDIEPLSGVSGRGSCMTYAMLFYKMAARLGIPVQICYGYADNGQTVSLHAWNVVEVNGEPHFYDVTWYDNMVPDARYIHNKAPWGRKILINRRNKA